MKGSTLFFGSGSRNKMNIVMERVQQFEDLEADLLGVAVTELQHLVDTQSSITADLNDEEHIKRAMLLKDNVAKTMVLLNRLSIYSMSKRGVLPKDFGKGDAPDKEADLAAAIVEKASLSLVSDSRFR